MIGVNELQNTYEKALLNESELASLLGLSAWTVRRWRLSEGLPVIKIGGRFLYRFESVLEWLKTRETVGVTDDCSGELGVIRQVKS